MLAYAGKGRFVCEPVNLSALVRQNQRAVSEFDLEEDRRSGCSSSPIFRPSRSDPSQMQQVLHEPGR